MRTPARLSQSLSLESQPEGRVFQGSNPASRLSGPEDRPTIRQSRPPGRTFQSPRPDFQPASPKGLTEEARNRAARWARPPGGADFAAEDRTRSNRVALTMAE